VYEVTGGERPGAGESVSGRRLGQAQRMTARARLIRRKPVTSSRLGACPVGRAAAGAGAAVARVGHRGDQLRQRGARARPTPGWCPGQRLAGAGADWLIRAAHAADPVRTPGCHRAHARRHRHPGPLHHWRTVHQTLDQTVRAWHEAGRSQRAVVRELSIDWRKVQHIAAVAGTCAHRVPGPGSPG
jgi:hypothetical protein